MSIVSVCRKPKVVDTPTDKFTVIKDIVDVAKTAASSLNSLVYGAIGASLVAALATIVS